MNLPDDTGRFYQTWAAFLFLVFLVAQIAMTIMLDPAMLAASRWSLLICHAR